MQHLIKYAHQVRKSKHWQHTLYVMVVASMVLSLGQFSAPQTASAADTNWVNPDQNSGSLSDGNANNAYTNGNDSVTFNRNQTEYYYGYILVYLTVLL